MGHNCLFFDICSIEFCEFCKSAEDHEYSRVMFSCFQQYSFFCLGLASGMGKESQNEHYTDIPLHVWMEDQPRYAKIRQIFIKCRSEIRFLPSLSWEEKNAKGYLGLNCLPPTIPASIFLLKFNNIHTRTRCEIYSKLTILVSLLLTLNIFHTLR